jgi:predicted ATPase
MIKRLYINNFRCLQNFEIILNNKSSVLLLGKNGTGKSTVRKVLEILQTIARKVSRVKQLVNENDFTKGNTHIPIRFEIEVAINQSNYEYTLALELPEAFKELRVFEEMLTVDGQTIFSRKQAEVTLRSARQNFESQFSVDWHLVALPVIQERSENDPLHIFKSWLASTIILAPIPSRMEGESKGETLEPESDGSNFSEWFTGVLARYPAAYTQIEKHLRAFMPDLHDFINELISKESKNMVVRFGNDNNKELSVDFKELSDGEKCFFMSALVLAANKSYGPLFCFWDEPDANLSLQEVGQFVTSLRRSFTNSGQILVTSHNPEAIRKFSNENTYVLGRKSHLEPVVIRSLEDIKVSGDLVDALIRGDVNV